MSLMTAPADARTHPADPLHPLLASRRSGVLLHPTSLPGPHGSGDLGPSALHFLDWLKAAGQTIWQVLPLAPPGAGHSPYLSPSAFAGSPWLVDPDEAVTLGWVDAEAPPAFEIRWHGCDFARALPWRLHRLQAAWRGFGARADASARAGFEAFRAEQKHWLDDYALFMVADGLHGAPWTRWPAPLRAREPAAMGALRDAHADAVGFWSFVQWRFIEQWSRLRAAAHARGIHVLGDVPIFVAHHSADVWAHAALFRLDAQGEPTVVAGVPPDYFSATGQRWGNPLYRWDVMARDGYAWWRQRFRHQLALADLLRVEHFRGFEAAWEIPASEPTAVAGAWRAGPGEDFFRVLRGELGPLPLLAEDLGMITPAVHALRQGCGLPGMRVLHFAFGDDASNPYLPHNYEPRTVAYTGTHDNDTTVGWWQALGEPERAAVLAYLGPQAADAIHWSLIRALSQSVANLVVVPMQDVLGLEGRHRMNTPGSVEGCWRWRFDWESVPPDAADRLLRIARAHGRI